MIPCRVFLQKLQLLPQNTSSLSLKPKISLTLNSIYYDEIKPFQTKYFCLTAHDNVGIQAMFDISDQQNLFGKTSIQNAFKLAVESQIIQVTITANGGNGYKGIKEILLILSFQPVSAYNKKITENYISTDRRMEKIIQQNFNQNNSDHQLQVSFSHLSPRIHQSTVNFTKQLKLRDSYRDVPLFAESLKSLPEQADSLESLAQQRQKILGELFGKFKPIK